MKNKQNTGRIIGKTSLIILWIFGILIFIFALLSGSESFGGGFMGIIKNSPNALPWVLFLALVYLAGKWKLGGGILIVLLGFSMFYFFGITASNFQWPAFAISLLPIVLGGMLILSWGLTHQKNDSDI